MQLTVAAYCDIDSQRVAIPNCLPPLGSFNETMLQVSDLSIPDLTVYCTFEPMDRPVVGGLLVLNTVESTNTITASSGHIQWTKFLWCIHVSLITLRVHC